MNSLKRRKIFIYLKKHSSPKSIIFSKKLIVQKELRMNGQISGDVAEVVFFSHMVLQIVKVPYSFPRSVRDQSEINFP